MKYLQVAIGLGILKSLTDIGARCSDSSHELVFTVLKPRCAVRCSQELRNSHGNSLAGDTIFYNGCSPCVGCPRFWTWDWSKWQCAGVRWDDQADGWSEDHLVETKKSYWLSADFISELLS